MWMKGRTTEGNFTRPKVNLDPQALESGSSQWGNTTLLHKKGLCYLLENPWVNLWLQFIKFQKSLHSVAGCFINGGLHANYTVISQISILFLDVKGNDFFRSDETGDKVTAFSKILLNLSFNYNRSFWLFCACLFHVPSEMVLISMCFHCFMNLSDLLMVVNFRNLCTYRG